MLSPERIVCIIAQVGCRGSGGRGGAGLTDAVLGLEDLVVVLGVLDLCTRLPLIPVVLAAGAAALAL